MSKKFKKGIIKFIEDNPLEISHDAENENGEPNEEQKIIILQVVKTMKAYINAAENLLNDKYAHVKDLTPTYLVEPGKILVACCSEGVVIRYEHKSDKAQFIGGWFSGNLPQVASQLSQGLIQCYRDRNFNSTISTTGLGMTLFTENSSLGNREDVLNIKVGFDAVIEQPEQLPLPPQKPFRLLSVRNSLELGLMGELVPDEAREVRGKQFLTRTQIRLPVGWECIEIFPFFDIDLWKPEYAPIWAEIDILASFATRRIVEDRYQSLDPMASARNQYWELLQSFKDLLDSDPEREEILQVFLNDHPELLVPTYSRVFPKLRLGDHVTDFVFQKATGDYLLVEIERSTYQLFRNDGQQKAELTHAIDQLNDWKRYIEDNLRTVEHELDLEGISSNPEGIVVIGRSQALTSENKRKLTTMGNQNPKLKILTYDDVYENAKALVENLFGPIWNVPGGTQIYYLDSKTND